MHRLYVGRDWMGRELWIKLRLIPIQSGTLSPEKIGSHRFTAAGLKARSCCV